MVVVLGVIPVSAPLPTRIEKDRGGFAIRLKHAWYRFAAITEGFAGIGAHLAVANDRVLDGIDIDGATERVKRNPRTIDNAATVETRAIVGGHRGTIVSGKLVHRSNARDGKRQLVQRRENGEHLLGEYVDGNELADLLTTFEIDKWNAKQSQLLEAWGGQVFMPRGAPHARLQICGKFGDGLRSRHGTFSVRVRC